MQGTYRGLEMRIINSQEAEWLREKIFNMDYLTVIRGIPKASRSAEDAGNKGVGGKNINPDSQGTLEEIILGMVDYEYVIQILSTPVYVDTLKGWQNRSQRTMTEWYGQLQGQKNLSFNLSIPMMYMANASNSQGWTKVYTDADTVSYSNGENFSTSQGQSVGEPLSQSFGRSTGTSQGYSVTDSYSQSHSTSQGVSYGETIGQTVGQTYGQTVGRTVGQNAGQSLGNIVGQNVGQSMGNTYGNSANIGQNSSFSQSAGSSASSSFGESMGISTGQSVTDSVGGSRGVKL